MAKMWCIRCQAEREHAGDNSYRCSVCAMETLVNIQPNPNDTEHQLIRQMVGEAQRKARQTGQAGDIEVSRTTVNSSGEYQCRILVYNTYSGSFRTR